MYLPALAAGAGQTVKLYAWAVLAPQLLVNVAVAVQLEVSLMVCSRDAPDVPQPLHDQVPANGCGPSTTVEPAFSEAEDFTAHEVVPLMLR